VSQKLRSKIENLLGSDHAELDELFGQVFTALDAANHNESFQTLDLFWARLAMHIRAEHLQLFPAIRSIATDLAARDEINDLLGRLRHDHDLFMRELARAIKALRLVFYFGNEAETFEIVRQIITEVKQRLEIHNRLEEKQIYTLANENSMQSDEVENLSVTIKKELDNYPRRFASARRGA